MSPTIILVYIPNRPNENFHSRKFNAEMRMCGCIEMREGFSRRYVKVIRR